MIVTVLRFSLNVNISHSSNDYAKNRKGLQSHYDGDAIHEDGKHLTQNGHRVTSHRIVSARLHRRSEYPEGLCALETHE